MDVNLVRVIILCEGCNANVQSNYIRLKNGLKKIRVHLLCGKSHRRNPSKLAAVKIQSSILKNAQYVKNLSNSVNNAERYCNIFNVYRFTYFFFHKQIQIRLNECQPAKDWIFVATFHIEHNGSIKEFCVNGCKQSQNAFLSHQSYRWLVLWDIHSSCTSYVASGFHILPKAHVFFEQNTPDQNLETILV